MTASDLRLDAWLSLMLLATIVPEKRRTNEKEAEVLSDVLRSLSFIVCFFARRCGTKKEDEQVKQLAESQKLNH